MENGVTVLVVARRGQIGQPLLQLQSFPRHHFRNHTVMKLLEQSGIAAEIATVQQRNIELEVVAMKFAALRQRTGRRADAKVQIPERLGQSRDGLLLRGYAELGFVEEKYVYIGARKQRPAAITPERCDTYPIRPGGGRGRLAPQIAYQGISEIRTFADCRLPVVRLLESLTYALRLLLVRVL